jgi:O-antigen ligase
MSLTKASRRDLDAAMVSNADPVVHATDSYRMARSFLILMSLVTIDVFNVLDRGRAALGAGQADAQRPGPLRYVVLLVPILTIVWARMRVPSFAVRRPDTSDIVLFILFVLGLGGSLVGVAFFGTQDTVRPVFLPMILGLLFLFTLREPTDAEVGKMLRWLGWIGLVYVVMNAAVNTKVLPGLLVYKQYRNASFAYVALALACAFVMGRRGRLTALIVLTGVIFLTYPSATSLFVLAVVFLTLFLTARRSSGLRVLLVGFAVVLVTAIALLNFQTGVRLTSDYFSAVGKVDANNGRLDLWSAGVAKWEESPWIGRVFTGDAVAVRQRDQKPLPYHNDFVLFLAEGGLLGVGLLVGWMLLAEITIIRRYRGFVRSGQDAHANLLRVIIVCLNAFFVAMAFNPVLPGASRSATIFGLYAIAMSLGTPAAPPVLETATLRTHDFIARAAPSS